VVKVTEIIPGKTVTLDDARAKIEGEVKQEQAKEKIYDVVQKYDDAHSGGASMAEAAKAAGQKVESGPPISSTGQTESGSRAQLPPKVLQTIFTLPAGGESDVIDLGQGEYWVVHIDKVLPTTPYTLDEKIGPTTVRDEVTKAYMTREMVTRLRAKADALTAEVKGGKSIEAAAAEVGGKVEQASNVLRTAAQQTAPNQPPAYSQDFLGAVFNAKVGDVVAGSQSGPPGVVIAKLTKIQEPPAPMLAAYAEAVRRSTTSALDQDLNNAARTAAVLKMKPTTDPKLARRALGIEADPTAPATPVIPGKPKG
jgi:peptidyl-prolyl cis-trans isomerase D